MTMPEWMLEADFHISQTPEGRSLKKRDEWLEDAELTEDEWWAKHGASKD